MLGVLANSLAVLIGGVIGMLFGSRIKSKYTDSLMVALGLATMGMGVVSTVGTTDVLCIIVCCALGTVIGELLRIDDGVNALGRMAESRFGSRGGKGGSFTSAFVSCSIMFCIGSMAVMGSLEAGIHHNYAILFSKSVIDGVMAVTFAAAMGVGVAFSALPILIYEGGLTLLAQLVGGYLGEAVVLEMSAVGGTIIAGIALNMLGLPKEKIRVGNLLTAIFLPIAYVPLADWLVRLT